jgi:hypothetical protein
MIGDDFIFYFKYISESTLKIFFFFYHYLIFQKMKTFSENLAIFLF